MSSNEEVLAAQIQQLQEQVRRLEEFAIDATANQVEADPDGDTQASSTSSADDWLYTRLEDWVREVFIYVASRQIGSTWRWCSQWWNHVEAIGRLTVLWHGWEAARVKPEALPGWWMMFDHHTRNLFDPTCTFADCTQDECAVQKPLRYVDPPQGWSDPVQPGDD